jgi:putative component of membrane protein insertase Oxa1/YidC/SpoIIIJ protein YidD
MAPINKQPSPNTGSSMSHKTLLIFFLSSFLMISCGGLQAGDESSPGPFSAMIKFYQGPLNHLSAVRHGECPMYPSCSEYARQAIEKHGEGKGWIMTCDRLMRCGRDETRSGQMIRVHGQWKYYDPLKNNEFWETPQHQQKTETLSHSHPVFSQPGPENERNDF